MAHTTIDRLIVNSPTRNRRGIGATTGRPVCSILRMAAARLDMLSRPATPRRSTTPACSLKSLSQPTSPACADVARIRVSRRLRCYPPTS